MAIDIDNILFDLGGVVLDIDPQRAISAFKELGLKDIEKQISKYHHDGVFIAFERGEIDEDEFVHLLREQLPFSVNDELILSAWESMLVKLPKERVDFIEGLKSNFHTMLLSNTNPTHIKYYQRMGAPYGDMSQLFHQQFLSFQMGCSKPDLEIYQKVIEEGAIDPTKTLFLDDSELNLSAASELGFKTELVTDTRDMMTIIKDRFSL